MTSTQKSPAAQTMTQWSTLIGHDKIRRWFASAIGQGRLGGSFLLVGSPGIGKHTVADLLARTLLCEVSEPHAMSPCGTCPACLQVAAQTHPDVIRVAKPDDKSTIPIELLVGPVEARMREGFCHDVRIKPQSGNRKIGIIEDADFLSEPGSNCLLKTLEEPPAAAIILLIGTSEQKQLPTIRSRSQVIRMGPLAADDAVKLIREVHRVDASDQQIQTAVEMSGGDMHAALRLLASESKQLCEALTAQLNADQVDPAALSRIISSYVDDAGKDSRKRRAAMRDAFSISLQHFRQRMRQQTLQSRTDAVTMARVDRSLEAFREVDCNANQATLIECFSTDIAAGTTGRLGGYE